MSGDYPIYKGGDTINPGSYYLRKLCDAEAEIERLRELVVQLTSGGVVSYGSLEDDEEYFFEDADEIIEAANGE